MVIPFSLLDEIRGLQENRESGVLTLTKLDQRVSVYYREGMIQAASSNLDAHRIGAYLIRESLISDTDVPKIVADARRQKILFGEAAVRRKLLDPAELAEVVRRQALELLKHAFTNGFMRDSFTRGLKSYFVSANINAAYFLLELSRSNPKPFDASPATVIALKNGDDLSGLPWYPKELCVLGELNSSTTVPCLVQSTGIEETALKRILGVFERLGMIETLDDRGSDRGEIVSSSALMKRSSFPIERLVPLITNAVPGEKLEVLRNPSSFISEQFKTLKIRLREDIENPPHVMTISSPDPQDGKSLVGANLALALSMETGKRTVIVDCDLRNPTLSKHLGVSVEPGLIQYLSSTQMSPYCFMRRLGSLYLMTAGGIAENPVDLLSMGKMKEFIEQLRMDFDTVILDAPPMSPIADARIVSGLSDGIVLVIRRGKTANRSIETAFKVMDPSKLIGVVFNDVKPMLFNTYFSRSYYNYGVDSRYLYSGNRKARVSPKNYLES